MTAPLRRGPCAMTTTPQRLIDLAAKGGDRAVRDDPDYPPPGEERAAFWRRVMAQTLGDRGPTLERLTLWTLAELKP